MSATTLSDAAGRFLAWCEVNRSKRTTEMYRHYLSRFEQWAGNIDVSTLTPAKLGAWSPKFHPLRTVQRLAAWMTSEERTLSVNPLAGMGKGIVGERKRTFRRAEAVRLLRAADQTYRRVQICLRESGMRPQEVRAVWWEDLASVDGELWDAAALVAGRAYFSLPEGKGFFRRKEKTAVRIVAISPRLGRLLVRLSRRLTSPAGPIFRNRFGKPWTANAVRCRVRRLRELVAIGPDRRGERIVTYTWRHTFATDCVKAGVRDFRLAEIMGHTSARTTARYVHLRPDDVVEAMGTVWEVKAADQAKKRRPDSRRNASDAAR